MSVVQAIAGRAPHDRDRSTLSVTRHRDATHCPHCLGGPIWRHGHFVCKDGSRVQRFRCQNCGRCFNPATGTIEHRLQKRSAWQAALDGPPFEQPLRGMAASLGIHLSTAFRWRHRLLSKLASRPVEMRTGQVGIDLAYVRYSEKGSRTGWGPGSWGNPYGAKYRLNRGPRSAAAAARYQARPLPPRAERFRFVLDARPILLLCARDHRGQLSLPLGQQPAALGALSERLLESIANCSLILNFGPDPFAQACRSAGLIHKNGLGLDRGTGLIDGQISDGEMAVPISRSWQRRNRPELPHLWFQRFRGIASRYLQHYLAWFDQITIAQCSPGEALGALG